MTRPGRPHGVPARGADIQDDHGQHRTQLEKTTWPHHESCPVPRAIASDPSTNHVYAMLRGCRHHQALVLLRSGCSVSSCGTTSCCSGTLDCSAVHPLLQTVAESLRGCSITAGARFVRGRAQPKSSIVTKSRKSSSVLEPLESDIGARSRPRRTHRGGCGGGEAVPRCRRCHAGGGQKIRVCEHPFR